MSDEKYTEAIVTDVESTTKEKDVIPYVDTELEKQAVRRLDWSLLPVMTMFYLLSFLDRANIGNARVAGLQKDLKLTDAQYQTCVTILFVPYIASELPSNLLLKKIGPSVLMPALLTIWGIMTTLQGLVTSYTGLLIIRAFLGACEGPMFPGIVLYLSGFYTRKELSLRVALFFSSASLSGAFSGLLAAAIQGMDGVGGKPGWAWIFILEGLFTVSMGILGFFLIPTTPRESKFLTLEQKELIMARLERDRPTVQPIDKFTFKEVFRSLSSPHVILVCITFFMVGTTLFGLAFFLPSIVSQLGFDRNTTQLLSVGPFAVGFIFTLIVAYTSDRYNSRAIPMALVTLLAVAGYSMYLSAKDRFTAYGALYLMVPGVYATTPVMTTWLANNSDPYYRRATSIAMGFVTANAGGILSTWLFPTKEGPKFRKTTILNLVFVLLIVLGTLLNRAYLLWMNKSKLHAGYREKMLAKYGDENDPAANLRAWTELGDKHPDFRYTL